MSDGGPEPTPDDAPAGAISPGEVESAGRSCLVILLLGAVLLVLLCAGLALRWVFL
jgi:hypothetical protein